MTEPVSWLRLERYHLGELPAGERAEIGAHLADCARCRGCLDQIRNAAPDDLPSLPPFSAAVVAAIARAGKPRARWLPRAAALGVLGAAAAAFVAIARHPAPSVTPALSARTHIKGGEVTLELVRERDGSIAHEPTTFAAGDRFKLLVTCPPPLRLHVDVVVVQDGGPAFPGEPTVLGCGNRVPLPAAFRITGTSPATICLLVDPSTPPPRARAPAQIGARDGGAACLRLEHVED